MVRFLGDVPGEIIYIVERQPNYEPRSSGAAGSKPFFHLSLGDVLR
jgi:hypothetical protein